ncbi:MAG: hypothetical protein H8D96_19910 [Desulfobacterales bacterium]|uniref:Uncharacterized protein n=1 Tax=Candidatus Desulfatibia vada TaxID=2841696 RepID=A0A8J6TUK3_9BACT|nr:hypothetical protein [Candidatus Desulfatibia vada]MBL6970493.1 hypothetical protein [Desulfobacterales bacterium]
MINKVKAFWVIRIFSILICLFSGCGYFESKEDISAWVKQSLEEKIQEGNSLEGLSIGEIALVRESVNKFTGYVEFRLGTDTEKATLTVTLDGSQKMYQCDPPRLLLLKRNLRRLGW